MLDNVFLQLSRSWIFVLIAVAGGIFLLFYKFYWSKKIDRDEVLELLSTKGIGDRPETIVRDYYKTQGQVLQEKDVKKLTKQFIQNNKEFFLTMYDIIKKGKNKT